MKKFVALKQVIDDTKCDHTAHEILRANIDEADPAGDVRRADKIILKVRKNHAERCLSVYPAAYLEKKKQLDDTVLRRVKEIGDNIIDYDLLSLPSAETHL